MLFDIVKAQAAMEEAYQALKEIKKPVMFMSAIASIIDYYQAENDISDDEIERMLTGIVKCRKDVNEELGRPFI